MKIKNIVRTIYSPASRTNIEGFKWEFEYLTNIKDYLIKKDFDLVNEDDLLIQLITDVKNTGNTIQDYSNY